MDAQLLENFTIGFSPEEMLFLLDSFGVPEVPGFDRERFDQLPDEEYRLIREVSRRGLLARQVLVQGGQDLYLDPIVGGLFACNLAPEHSVIISQKSSDDHRRDYYFHSQDKAHIMHWQSEQQIHQYVILSDKEALFQMMLDILNLESASLPAGVPKAGESFRIDQDSFENAQQAAVEDGQTAQAAALFQQAGIGEQAAQELANCLAAPHVYRAVVAFHHNGEETDLDIRISLILGQNSLWSIKEVEDGDEWQLQSTHASQVAGQIREFLAVY